MYAVLDVETTGGSPKRERIIEIAIIKTDGEKIIDTYQTLINPEKNIPPFVCQLTGISNKMVEQAPLFESVAQKIDNFTKECTIVAHNAHFDYGFLKNEFKYIGSYYDRYRICTVKLTQRAYPGLDGYSLDKLTSYFKIEHKNKHRAFGDTEATTHLFHILLQKSNPEILAQFMHKGYFHRPQELVIKDKVIAEVPEETGLLSFYGEKDEVLYVFRSHNLFTRITDMLFYFDPSTHRGNMLKRAKSLKYTITGSEILSQILEIATIRANKPEYNKKNYGLKLVELKILRDKNGYDRIELERTKNMTKANTIYFSNYYEGNAVLGKLIKIHRLCADLNLKSKRKEENCVYYENNLCNGACVGKEDSASYNKRLTKVLKKLNYSKSNFVLVDEGPKFDQRTLLIIKNNLFFGYKIVREEEVETEDIDYLQNLIKVKYHPAIDQQIKKYIEKNKDLKIIAF